MTDYQEVTEDIAIRRRKKWDGRFWQDRRRSIEMVEGTWDMGQGESAEKRGVKWKKILKRFG